MKTKKIMVSLILGLCIVCVIGILSVKPIIIEKHYDYKTPSYFAAEDNKLILSNQLETYRNDIRQEYRTNQEALDKKFDFFLAILSIAIAVWIGLNIYNYLDKKDLEKLTDDYDNLLKKANELENKIEDLKKWESLINEIAERMKSLESTSADYGSIMDKLGSDIRSQIATFG